MEKDLQYFHDLISRYLSGELAGDELSALSAWLKSDPANQKVFNEYKSAWEAVEKSKIEAFDLDKEFALMKTKIPSARIESKEPKVIRLETETRSRRTFVRQALRIAAVLVILLGIVYVIYNYTRVSTPSQMQLVAMNEKVEGKLPDGSVVTLNAGSTLDYPEKFTGDNRPVTLKGEAFFEVAPDKSKPFVISANEMMVEVVGTSFLVNAQSNGNVEVIVKTGKVAVYYKNSPAEKTYLEPGDKAEFTGENKKISESENTDENYIAWKTNILTFNDATMEDVVTALNEQYKANITIKDEKLKTLPLTGTYSNKSLDEILTLIESSLGIHVNKISDKQIELSGYETK